MADLLTTTHNVKVSEHSYNLHKAGQKPFSIRRNDRFYQKGDFIIMTPVDRLGLKIYGLDLLEYQITCVIDYQQKEGYVVLGLRTVEEE